MAERIVSLGHMLNIAFRLAYNDPVGNLPNLIATQRKLELTLAEASASQQQFSVFLIDGDDLKRYNKVSYAAGDLLIAQLSAALISSIRPGDFVGRWRFGDEFILILPDTDLEHAVKIGERVRLAVWEASQEWLFPTSVSIGVVHCPRHGVTLDELQQKAELALAQAKASGKNRVVLAP
jgi:diguanylate cyclase (GGDEF)-like protein